MIAMSRGALYVITGCKLLAQPGIRRYVLIPLFINFALLSIFITLGIQQFESLISTWLPTLPAWLQWLDWLIWPLFLIIFLASGFLISLMLANVIAAPFNGFLAEAVARKLNPNIATPATHFMAALSSIGPSFVNEIKKLIYFIVRAVPLLILFVIPGVNLMAPFIWLAFSAWLLAQEYLDYPLANQNILFAQQHQLIKTKRSCTFGFGATILLLTMTPVLNFLAMPIAVAGATSLAIGEGLSAK